MHRILLDTNVLLDAHFLHWLKRQELETLMSSVSVTEFAYHLFKKGKGERSFRAFIDLYTIRVCNYGEKEAIIAAKNAVGRWDFRLRARDYAIGATALSNDAVLVTRNIKDFGWLPKSRVSSPEALRQIIHR
ncbi:MAG: type II toxin-antitoxin system VapC family toxin [Nitrososphaerales archaeon]